MAEFEKSGEIGKRLFWLSNASDGTLKKLYKSCSCLLMASEGEGFGLPLIEASKAGMPVIARDIPVFHELLGEGAIYFDNTRDPIEIVDCIEKFLRMPSEVRPKINAQRWISWNENGIRTLKCLMAN